MTSRSALIIVVPEIHSNPRLGLPVVLNDAKEIEQSLKQSGYQVRTIGSGSPQESSKGVILSAIRKACADAKASGTLLLFFSGHGVHLGGHDYIVPYDVDLNDNAVNEYLIRVSDISRYVAHSRAANVVLFIDACRENFSLGKDKSLGRLNWGAEQREPIHDRRYSIVFACEPNEYATYVSGSSGFSLFSRALAQSLSSAHSARSLKQVIASAQETLNELARQNNKPNQTIKLSTETDLVHEVGSEIICEGSSGPTGRDHTPPTWSEAVLLSGLWENLDQATRRNPQFNGFRAAVAQLAHEAQTKATIMRSGLGNDPWFDQQYPHRTLRRLEDLTQGYTLTLPEVALITAAPFIREHANAAAIAYHIEVKPLEVIFDASALDVGLRQRRLQIDASYKSFSHLIRRSDALLKLQSSDIGKTYTLQMDSRSIMLWAFHKHLARSGVQWQKPPSGSLPKDMINLPDKDDDDARYIAQVLSERRLVKLGQCIRGDVDRLIRQDLPNPLENIVSEGGEQIRERLLGTLLCIAGWMSIDVTAFSDVIADHVGIGDPVVLSDVHAVIDTATWTTVGRMLQLTATSNHPAIDFALRESVADMNRVLTAILRFSSHDPTLREWATTLPGQLTADGLSPSVAEGKPAFTVPHQRFTLANDEIKEILMGEELYGEPGLAIRELYQNALDACRYRLARTAYLSRRGYRSDWKGKIEFLQGSEGGRSFIECRDTGIGMSMRELESCFSRAGRRFSDLPEYIEEQQQWLNADPKIEMTPNSRFGIGVLSYFMIADEIEISSCRLDREGNPSARINVTIPGSGSLFRVQTADNGHEAGTRIRLYLRDDWEGSCRQELENFLRLAEFETKVQEGRKFAVWQPLVPRLTESYLATSNPDIWWDSRMRSGQVVADGITTSFKYHSKKDALLFPEELQPTGLLLNLRGRLRPRLSVDRKQIISFDEEAVEKMIEAEVPHLANATWLRLTWLWHLSKPLSKIVERYLISKDAYVPLGYFQEIGSTMRARRPSESLREQAISAGSASHAYPIRVLGVNEDDDAVVSQLISSFGSMTAQDKLRFLDSAITLHTLFRGAPNTISEMESWCERRLLTLKTDRVFAASEKVLRMALYAKLGMPCADWLKNLLPDVDVEQAAKRLNQPFEKGPSFWRRFSKYVRILFFVMCLVVAVSLIAAFS